MVSLNSADYQSGLHSLDIHGLEASQEGFCNWKNVHLKHKEQHISLLSCERCRNRRTQILPA